MRAESGITDLEEDLNQLGRKEIEKLKMISEKAFKNVK